VPRAVSVPQWPGHGDFQSSSCQCPPRPQGGRPPRAAAEPPPGQSLAAARSAARGPGPRRPFVAAATGSHIQVLGGVPAISLKLPARAIGAARQPKHHKVYLSIIPLYPGQWTAWRPTIEVACQHQCVWVSRPAAPPRTLRPITLSPGIEMSVMTSFYLSLPCLSILLHEQAGRQAACSVPWTSKAATTPVTDG
jgi:hypothetical protein